MSIPQFTRRRAILTILLVLGVGLLGVELLTLGRQFLASPLNDYDLYIQRATLAGTNGFSLPEQENPFPLPTTVWIFLPLSLMPPWFKIVWIIVPYLTVLYLFGKAGVIWWVYYPMMIQGATGQMDGWLLLPLVWLLENRPKLAGIGAVLLLFKPQLAWLTVLVSIILWIRRRDKGNLYAFVALFAIIWLPPFLIRPTWPLDWITPMLRRANESIMPTRGATIWGWWWHGGPLVWLIPLVIALALFLAYRVARAKPRETAELLDLLITPVLYASNMVMIIPIAKTRRHVIMLTLASWLGVAFDGLVGNWGGAYVILPLTGLWLLSNPNLPPLEKWLHWISQQFHFRQA